MGLKLTAGQIATGLGCCLLHITAGITTIWGSTNIYYLSYFHESDQSINEDTNSYILISIIIPLSIILILSTKLSDYLGYVRTIKLCAFVFFASQFIIYLKFTLVLFTIFTLIIPVSCITVSLIPAINLLWSHFLHQKSICTAFTLVFLGLGTIVWNLAFIGIVNPENHEAKITSNSQAFFQKDVSQKVDKATKIIMFLCSVIYLVGAFLMRQAPKENPPMPVKKERVTVKAVEENEQNLGKEKKTCERLSHQKGSEQVIKVEDDIEIHGQIVPGKLDSNQQKLLLTALKDPKCLFIFLLLIVIDIYPIYLLNNFKVIYMPIFNDDRFLALCIVVNTVANILGTFLWGFLAHKIGNVTTVAIVVSFTFLGGILGFFSHNHIVLLIFMFIFGVGDRGMETLAGPTLVQIYGLRTATLLLPYKGLSLIIGFLLAPILQLLTTKFLSPFEELAFMFIFIAISFVIGIYYAKKYREFDLKNRQRANKLKIAEGIHQQQMMQYQKFQGEMQAESKVVVS